MTLKLTVKKDEGKEITIPEELRNSTEKILQYSDISKKRADMFRANLEIFKRLQDKSMYNPETRKVQGAVTSVFFEVYAAVFKKVLEQNNQNPLYQMFLMYAYMDEQLLKPEQTIALYELFKKPVIAGKCSVFNGKTWLEEIFNRKKDPSINEFEQDYYEVFREKMKRGELREQDKSEYVNNIDGRLDHEINNLFKIGQRLCCGQMSGYFPILHSGIINRDLTKALVTPNKIEESLNKVLEIDFSAFHREIVYNCPEKGISKELIMKFVLPDFILMPTFGSRAVMWQEITGRVRNSPGRFIFPVFTGENIDKLMVEVIAKFRWDLSKTMSSSSRNDVDQNSLIGDYTNYIQFFKKNRELSNEAKEKIKMQIERCRNSFGDIFASDYHTWINYESKGLMRLNKVSRGILFKHCPFAKSVRESLEKHPLYNPHITKFNNNRMKEAKFIKARYYKLTKRDTPLDPELKSNLMFYKM